MKLKSNLYAPILFCVVLIFAGLSGLMISLIRSLEVDAFLSSAIIQLVVYLLPLAFYCKVRGLDVISALKFRHISPGKIPFLINMALIFFVGSALFRYFGLFFFDSAMVETPSALVIPVESGSRFLTFLCSVILPAVLEEMLFRGVLLEEYRSYGFAWSVAASSLMFSMLHLSLSNFVYYVFMGLILGVVTLASDSILPAIILHAVINFTHQYVRPYAVEYLRQAGKSRLLPYLMTGLFLLLFVFLFSGLESFYQGKAYHEILQSRKELLKKEVENARILREEEKEEKPPRRFLLSLKEIFLSPTFLASVAIFAVLVFQIFKGV